MTTTPQNKPLRTLGTRKLGRQGLEVSTLGLGCMGMSYAYGPADDDESIATIHRALELGVTFFDTAEVYGPFLNEALLARALEGRRRDGVVIATKFGFKLNDKGERVGVDSSAANIKRAVEGSLKRLRTDRIDVLYQHRVDKRVPIEEVVGVMAELVKQGKVRWLGLSEAGVDTIRRAHAVHPISVLQSEYSLWERNLDDAIVPLLRQLGIGLVPFSPLGRGFLTGTSKRAEEQAAGDFRKESDPRFRGENFDENQRIVDAVKAMAQKKSVSAAQVALAWVLAKGDDIVPIPGTKRRKYLEDNVGAAAVALDAADVAVLDALPRPSGARYTDAGMALVDR